MKITINHNNFVSVVLLQEGADRINKLFPSQNAKAGPFREQLGWLMTLLGGDTNGAFEGGNLIFEEEK